MGARQRFQRHHKSGKSTYLKYKPNPGLSSLVPKNGLSRLEPPPCPDGLACLTASPRRLHAVCPPSLSSPRLASPSPSPRPHLASYLPTASFLIPRRQIHGPPPPRLALALTSSARCSASLDDQPAQESSPLFQLPRSMISSAMIRAPKDLPAR